MFNVFVTRKISESGLQRMQDEGLHVDVWPHRHPISKDELRLRASKAHAIISMNSDRIDKDLFDAAPELQIVANYIQGYDNMDIALATQRGVALTYTPDVMTDTKAEMIMTLITSMVRHIHAADKYMKEGHHRRWEPLLFLGTELRGKTIGFIGMSAVAMRVAEIAQRGFEMDVIFYDEDLKRPSVKATQVSLDEVLTLSDIVSIHLPALPTTTKVIGSEELLKMKDTAYLVNTARGTLIDESALVHSLRGGRLAGAALDVLHCEMLGTCDPKDHAELKRLHNVILTPQISTATWEARNAMSLIAAEDVIAVAKGQRPKHVINPEIYDEEKTTFSFFF